MMFKKILLLGAAFIALSTVAQTLPNKCTAFLPRVLNSTTILKENVEKLANSGYGQNGGSTEKFWDVYSDRCDNPLYSAPGGSKNGKTLSFNQKVRISKIEKNYALVYTENRPGGTNYPSVSGSVECLGWVPMSNLLLWNQCPTNQFGVYHKALIVYNIDQQNDANLGRISQHPDPAVTKNTQPIKASIDFHYIMKEEKTSKGTRYLIASSSRIAGGKTENVLEGWISSNSFTPWNQRTCLEPNWDSDDVSYFISKKEQARLYDDARLTQEAQGWTFGQKNKEGQAATQYRMPPRSMRFPILDNDAKLNESTFKITAFGTPGGGLGINDVAGEIDESRKAKEEHLNKVSHVNIIVVMDATSSMNKYFAPMAKAVQQATQFLEGEVTVGAVLYRDYPDGDNVIEFHKMAKPNAQSLQSFFANAGRNGYGSKSVAKTAHEAMYLGIKTALDYNKMGYSPDQTNVLFIVGDCGNNPEDNKVTMQEIQQMAHKVEAQMFSFQVVNQDKAAWDDFNLQINELFIDQMKHLYTSLDSKAQVGWANIAHGKGVRTNTTEHFYTSATARAQVGMELSEGELTKLIQDTYIDFRKALEAQKEAINNIGMNNVMGQKKDDKLHTVSVNDAFLRRRLGPDYEKILQATSLLAYNGYARQDDGNGHDYWQAVIFLSAEELKELNTRLEPLKTAVKTNTYTDQDRNNYVKAITGIIQSMTEKSAAEIDEMSTDEITRIIGGLNATTPMLRGNQTEKTWTLAQIKNRQACSDQEFKAILRKMATKIDELSKLSGNSSFKYSFVQNGHTYYWVPLYMIP